MVEKNDFEKLASDEDFRQRNQFNPGTFTDANAWSKLPGFKAKGWRKKVFMAGASILIIVFGYIIISSIISVINI